MSRLNETRSAAVVFVHVYCVVARTARCKNYRFIITKCYLLYVKVVADLVWRTLFGEASAASSICMSTSGVPPEERSRVETSEPHVGLSLVCQVDLRSLERLPRDMVPLVPLSKLLGLPQTPSSSLSLRPVRSRCISCDERSESHGRLF